MRLDIFIAVSTVACLLKVRNCNSVLRQKIMRQSEIGGNASNKPSLNYANRRLLQMCK